MKKNDMSTLLNNLLKEVVGEMNVQLKSRIDKLNESIENENFGYSGFLSEKVNDIMNVSKEIRQPEMNEYELTKEEMINLVLNFYKEMLPNYYDRAKKVINSEDGNVLEITEIKEKEHEKHTKGYMIHDYSNCTNKVVIPSIFNLRNALTLVHEIGHAMDTSNSNLEKNYTLYNYKIRSFLSETTAVTFEKIFLDYLWNNTNYPKENIASIMTHRYNYLLKYGRYHLLDKIITLPDEYISVQDLVSIMKFAGVKYDDDMEYLKLIEEYLDCGFDSYIENLNYINALSFSEIIYKHCFTKSLLLSSVIKFCFKANSIVKAKNSKTKYTSSPFMHAPNKSKKFSLSLYSFHNTNSFFTASDFVISITFTEHGTFL